MTEMSCCGCFSFSFLKSLKEVVKPSKPASTNICEEFLLNDDPEEEQGSSTQNDDMIRSGNANDVDFRSTAKQPQKSLLHLQHGLICREFPVKETNSILRSKDENGKRINEYVHVQKIGAGSKGKVVLYRSCFDRADYAIKVFSKSHLSEQRSSLSETALSDVRREVLILKELNHPNIVNLVEVIDDPTDDHLYMVLEYVEGKWVFDDAGPPRLGEETARKYLRDIVSGLIYLHSHNIVHGDIKPDNLLVTGSGTVKIVDFGVSQVFEEDNDDLRHSPVSAVFTPPECCLGLPYNGKAADTWALGITLYCMVQGTYPFLGETDEVIYDTIVDSPLFLPDEMTPLLKNLLEGLLCKDPGERMSLHDVAQHAWVIGEWGPIPQYLCWCKRKRRPGMVYKSRRR